tara:strand:+ start:1768 stop:1899 length:132 start_codon:yes stop_codon:yes gene_type:complete
MLDDANANISFHTLKKANNESNNNTTTRRPMSGKWKIGLPGCK